MRIRSLLAAAVPVALAAVLVGAGPAAAHDTLVGAAPAADSTVAGDVDEVVLTLSEPPLSGLETGIVISVTGPDGAERTSGDVRTEGDRIAKDVDLAAAGPYAVTWRSVSVDGHPISGSYRFTSSGAPEPAPASATTPATAGTATPTPTATTATLAAALPSGAASPAAAGHQHGTMVTLWFLVGLVVLVVVAVLVTRVVSRRRPTSTDTGTD